MFSRRSAIISLLAAVSLNAETVISLHDFDPACGQPGHDCRLAFQKAFQAAARVGGATLRLPAGTFPIDFPEAPNDAESGRPLDAGSLLTVPSHVMLQGHLDANGAPDTTIEWRNSSIPAFIFARASYSGMKDLHLRFTGLTPTRFPYGDIALLRALRYRPVTPNQNQMSGGNYEMFSFSMLFDSSHCVFENLVFDSATHDNQHVFGFAFNVKGSGVSVAGDGGLTALADGNRFSRISLNDYVMGLLVAGQQNVVIENITADRRGSTAAIAPGHVIYFTGSNLFGPGAKATVSLSRNVRVTNVSEGPHTYSNSHALGTLALKYIDGGTFEHITSQHPIGLIQSLNGVKNLVFSDLHWSGDAAACGEPADYCGAPVIESVVSKPGEPPIENLRFTNVSLTSTHQSITTNLTGKAIDVDGMTIQSPPVFNKTRNQQAPYGALGMKEASDVTVRKFVYVPVLTSVDSTARYNQPFVCWGSCTNVKADVTVKWPGSVAMPAPGHAAITSGIQFDKPGANNSIVSHTEVHQ
jgi:hypothetical protein